MVFANIEYLFLLFSIHTTLCKEIIKLHTYIYKSTY